MDSISRGQDGRIAYREEPMANGGREGRVRDGCNSDQTIRALLSKRFLWDFENRVACHVFGSLDLTWRVKTG